MIKSTNSNNFMFMLFAVSLGLALVLNTISVIMYTRGGTFGLDVPMWALVLVSQLLAFGVPSAIYIAVHRDKIKQLLPLRRIGWKNVVFITCMTIAIQPAFMMINLVSQFIFPNVIGEVIGDVSQEGGLLLMLFTIALIPSIFEEIAYRGIGFAGFKHTSLRKAAIVNGLFFGMIHMNMNQFLYAFVLGAVFCYFVYYTKSLWAPFLAHLVFNGTQVLLLHAITSIDPDALEAAAYVPAKAAFASSIIVYGVLVLLALGFTAAFVRIYIAFRKHNLERNERDGIVTDTFSAYKADGHQPQQAFTLGFKLTAVLFALLMLATYLLPLFENSYGAAL